MKKGQKKGFVGNYLFVCLYVSFQTRHLVTQLRERVSLLCVPSAPKVWCFVLSVGAVCHDMHATEKENVFIKVPFLLIVDHGIHNSNSANNN